MIPLVVKMGSVVLVLSDIPMENEKFKKNSITLDLQRRIENLEKARTEQQDKRRVIEQAKQLFDFGLSLSLVGFSAPGNEAMNIARETLRPMYDAGAFNKDIHWDYREIAHSGELPSEMFRPVMRLNVREWDVLQQEHENIGRELKNLFFAVWRSRILQGVQERTIDPELAGDMHANRVFIESNYPAGLSGSHYFAHLWDMEIEKVQHLYALQTKAAPQPHMDQYLRKFENYSRIYEAFYRTAAPQQREVESPFFVRVIDLPDTFVQANQVRNQARRTAVNIFDSSAASMVRTVNILFEELSVFVVQAILKKEGYWTDGHKKIPITEFNI